MFALFQLLSPNVQFLTYSERASEMRESEKTALCSIITFSTLLNINWHTTVKVEMHYAAAV